MSLTTVWRMAISGLPNITLTLLRQKSIHHRFFPHTRQPTQNQSYTHIPTKFKNQPGVIQASLSGGILFCVTVQKTVPSCFLNFATTIALVNFTQLPKKCPHGWIDLGQVLWMIGTPDLLICWCICPGMLYLLETFRRLTTYDSWLTSLSELRTTTNLYLSGYNYTFSGYSYTFQGITIPYYTWK